MNVATEVYLYHDHCSKARRTGHINKKTRQAISKENIVIREKENPIINHHLHLHPSLPTRIGPLKSVIPNHVVYHPSSGTTFPSSTFPNQNREQICSQSTSIKSHKSTSRSAIKFDELLTIICSNGLENVKQEDRSSRRKLFLQSTRIISKDKRKPEAKNANHNNNIHEAKRRQDNHLYRRPNRAKLSYHRKV